ncbi:dehydrogenase [Labedella phragmitis]|uniref:Dehydrogenase n=1 Tax=Labedella phragmitis TaxID=2498849 RepID=A0A3S4DKV2_9MICO|nr:SseB family protein [Labedella phragmitis]RWZ50835.1 dehydrogenase [Labedella phragmitis]
MAKKQKPDFSSPVLADALEKQDMAAVAFALRNHPVVVPLATAIDRDKPTATPDVWMYRQPETARLALLLFSDAKNKPEALPPFVGLYDGEWLSAFLRTYGDDIETVFFDIAGPHAMQATPAEVQRVLGLAADEEPPATDA